MVEITITAGPKKIITFNFPVQRNTNLVLIMLKKAQDISYSPPYTLTVKNASEHFGLASNTLYHWINDGKLIRGKHYLKVGRKVLIVRDEFIELLGAIDGCKE